MIDVPSLTQDTLIDDAVFEYLFSIKDSFERTKAESKIKIHAKKLGMSKIFDENYKSYKISQAKKFQPEFGLQTNFIGQPIKINCGDWIADGVGVRRNEFNAQSGSIQTKEASRIPILPVERYENMDTGIEKVKLSFYKDDAWKSIICEKITISNNNKIVELSNAGVEVTSDTSKNLVKYLYDCLTLNSGIIPKYKSVSRMGWVDNEFMPYDDSIKFDGEKDYKHLYQAINYTGDFYKWVSFMKPLRKNKLFRLTMSASFASVLLEKLSALPFVFHLWGGTGSGKTVAVMCAMSIWGNPSMGKMTRTMNMTVNSMLSTASFLYNLPFAGDELQTIKSKFENYDTLIMKITEGVDRGRMHFDRVQETKSWKCAFLFTGEEPCTKSGSGGGVINRVIDVECTEQIVEDGNKVVSFIEKNYGHAGVKFVEVLKDNNFSKDYNDIYKEILNSCDTTEKQALSMAAILLGDRISSEYIFGETPLEISDIKDYLVSKKEVDVAERAYEYTMNLIAINKNNFGQGKSFHDTTVAGSYWGNIDVDSIYFVKDVLERELYNAGFSLDAVKKKWVEKGYVQKDSQGCFRHQRKINGVTASFIKIIDLKAIEARNPYLK